MPYDIERSYVQIIEGIIRVINKIENFNEQNVMEEEWTPANAGVDKYAVIDYQQLTLGQDTFDGGYIISWFFGIRVYTRMDESPRVLAIKQARNRIDFLFTFSRYPDLDGVEGILKSQILQAVPAPRQREPGEVSFALETFGLRVDQQFDVDEEE